jgi:tetratricopeptide (TPR) repeat protein
MLATAPRESVTLSRLATRICSLYFWTAADEPALQGDAWREHAAALLSAADYVEADAACIRADTLYSLVDSQERVYERTHLILTQAQVAHFLGETKRALTLADTAAMTFEMAFPAKKRDFVRARTIYATMLVANQDYDEGLKILVETAAIAEAENDTETLAYLVNNIGQVHARLGNLKAAKECFKTALEGWTSLGLASEIPRVHGGLARILVQEGRYNDAISELYKARTAFLGLEMPVVAADVTLRIVETLFAAGRTKDIPSLCEEAIETFRKANLPREAAKALAYINACASDGTLTTDDVAEVREFLELLQSDPETLFESGPEQGGDE